ncbi:MAG: PKD domain-containing protein [Epsilonproteobacteria bacterium]|nr:PKD domain-containing protein [Campylobacterota bacterium]
MVKYSLIALAAATVLFTGCDQGECCGAGGVAPTAVIASAALAAGTLDGTGSKDNNDDGRIVKEEWSVDGTVVDPTNYVLAAGTHTVCLTVTDNDDLTNQTCQDVTIAAGNRAPTAAITAPTAATITCDAGEVVQFTGSGTDSDGEISSYAWTPASVSGSGANVTYTCPASGSQQVCLTVTDNDNAISTNSACKTVTVNTPTELAPTAVITALECSADNIVQGEIRVTCGESYDNDDVNQSSVSATDKNITRCEWSITAVDDDGPNDVHPVTFVSFPDGTKNGDGFYNVSGESNATEPKFIGEQLDYKIITLKVFDNDGNTNEVTKYHYYEGSCGVLEDVER